MTETVILPSRPATRRSSNFVVPLLVIPLVLYNLIVFLFFGGNPANWIFGLFSLPMPSGMPWAITAGDLLLVLGIVLLFFEVLKSTGTARNSIIEHMLSMVVFVVFLVEFLLVGAASSSVFFLLMVMSLIDVVAGFTVSITSASRDVSMN
ncbi:MAG: hypothetical protein IR164_09125 [Devosia sp.]|jgi:hypothetical protein|uniref:hypothetical protein n=1 Tax=unclassified Devosia TaxID=196773 RepID=UPI0019E27AB0|nr:MULTISPECIES: hypothetical protein [unclassified Devosia]MBF0679085.1 hypothetical protein [Devosia sp.]WEJ33700.1 hypothetical protein NYQ88_02410 [Devosia sp. SD17-2]